MYARLSDAGLFVFKGIRDMKRETKSIPYFEIKADSAGRVRTGIAAVFGNVDSYGDRLIPGAFAKTITENRSRVKHLWNHGFGQPPIASIKELREVGREDLPKAVLEYAPEATGGLLVSREYYKNDFADWVLQAIDSGDINEMSFGYDVIQATEVTENEQTIRELKEVKLYDTSDVLWGANAATEAVYAKSALMPIGVLAMQIQAFAADVKQGGREIDGNELGLIDAIYTSAGELRDMLTGEVVNGQETDTSEATTGDEAEAVSAKADTSLVANRLRLNRLRIDSLGL